MKLNEVNCNELCIIEIFMTIVWKLMDPNFQVNDKKIISYVRAIRNRSRLSRIFQKDSYKYEVFIFCLELEKNNFKVEKLRFTEIIEEKISNVFLKKSIQKLYDEILRIAKVREMNNINDIFYHSEDGIEILNITPFTYKILKNREDFFKIYIKLVFKGILEIKNQIIFENECFYTKNKKDFLEEKQLTKHSFSMLIEIKESFLEKMNIKLNDIEKGRVLVPNTLVLENLLNLREVNKKEGFKFLQEIVYLIQLTQNDNLYVITANAAEYKRDIVEIIENNIEKEEREIIDLLLNKLNVSLPTLYNIFKGFFSETPTKYIITRKFNKMCCLLKEKDDHKEICKVLNISGSTFSANFKNFSEKNLREFKKFLADKNNSEFSLNLPRKGELIERLLSVSFNKEELSNSKEKDVIIKVYEKLTEEYLKGKVGKIELLLEKYPLADRTKDRIKDKKLDIINILNYSLKGGMVIEAKMLFENRYFKMFQLIGINIDSYCSSYIHMDDAVMRIVLEGKIYYEDGFILRENDYTMIGPNKKLKDFKVLSRQTKVIMLVIKKEFIDRYKVDIKNFFAHSKISKECREILERMEKENLYDNPFLFLEMIVLFLKNNALFNENIFTISSRLIEKVNWVDILKYIDNQIEKNLEQIRKEILKKFKITRVILEKLCQKNTKMTFQKYLIKLKIDKIIEEYLEKEYLLEELLEKYNLKNSVVFEYNLKKIYSLSIANLKKIK